MPEWIPTAGQTFLVPSGTSGNHLFVILNNPDDFSDYGYGKQLCIVSVNFTTLHLNNPHDNACIVNAGEHPFISRDSYVRYRDARLDPVEHVKKMVNSGTWSLQEPASVQLLQKLRLGLQASKFAQRDYKKMLAGLN